MRRCSGSLAIAAVLAALVLPAAARAAEAPVPSAEPPAPASLVVALGLGNPSLQAGVVRGSEVILARGFEVELARVLARRLGARVDRFVRVSSPARLLTSSAPGWHLALAGIERSSAGAGAAVDLSLPYLTTDVAAVARRGLARPKRLADLRSSLLCAVRGTDAARAAFSVRPKRTPLLLGGPERLRTAVRTGLCDAAFVAGVDAGRFVAGRSTGLGPVVGRIARGDGLGVLVPRGEGLDVRDVDRELRALRRDGTLARLSRGWFGLDPAGLRVLR